MDKFCRTISSWVNELGKPQRDKGLREERDFVRFWHDNGVPPDACVRVPLSGAMRGYKGDVTLAGLQGEVKVRRSGYKTIYDQLSDNDFLAIRMNNRERLYVLPEKIMLSFIKSVIHEW